jgi:hypothetical protein
MSCIRSNNIRICSVTTSSTARMSHCLKLFMLDVLLVSPVLPAYMSCRVWAVADLAEVVQLLAPTHPQYTRAKLLALLGRNVKAS